MARFKAIRAGQRIPGGSRETRNIFVSVVSAYAPTAKAPLASSLPSETSSKPPWTGYLRVIFFFSGISMPELVRVHLRMISGEEFAVSTELAAAMKQVRGSLSSAMSMA